MRIVQRIVVTVVATLIALAVPAAAMAHEHRSVGPLSYVVGWLNEPTFAGSVNAVQLFLARGGAPVPDGTLQVVVIFGDRNGTQKSSPMDFDPSDETPGEYTSSLIPSRPGTYTFHITGTASGTKVDQYFTSGEKTFDDPKDPTASEFPAKDPTNGQLAQRLDSTDAKVTAVQPASSRSTIALIVGAVGLLVAIGAIVAGRR
jgi:hypothetical protein